MHSIGVANIVWNFTNDKTQTIAGLLHDISTPVFAHTIDFLNNDYMEQESTEDETSVFIRNSASITALLEKNSVSLNDVSEYSKYPIADNDTPMLSADRLEYTLGNGYIVHGIELQEIEDVYNDLTVVKNENGADELCFSSVEKAIKLVDISLQNSYWFVSDEDRFTMQYLADFIQCTLDDGILTYADLFTTESHVIGKLQSNSDSLDAWNNFTKISAVSSSTEKKPYRYSVKIPAKKRYINPLVIHGSNVVRVTDIDTQSKEKIDAFLSLDFNRWVFEI